MKYYKKIEGSKCYLSPVSFDDVELITGWLNDLEVVQYTLMASQILDAVKERDTLELLTKQNSIFAIVDFKNDTPIGICGLHDVHTVNRTAALGIFIGEKNYWGRGYGSEAICLLLDFAFNILNLNSVSLEVIKTNSRAVACYKKCGFVETGSKRQAVFFAGQYDDLLIFDILASEFTSPYVLSLIKPSD